MPDSSLHLLKYKKNMREQMRAMRQGNPANTQASFQKLCDVFASHISLPQGEVISSYCAFRDEMNPGILIEYLRRQGHKIALPAVVGKNMPLAFHFYEPGDALRPNSMNILEPLPTAPVTEPDVMLIPMLAFDVMRNRLGYGGGFYDRTIAALRLRKPVLAIGIAYAYQQLAEIPTAPHDIRLDKIVTEIGVLG